MRVELIWGVGCIPRNKEWSNRYTSLARRLAGGDVQAWFNNHVAQGAGDMVLAAVAMGLVFWLANFLYRKKVFLRF